MPVTQQTFQQLALEDPEGHWELHCGRPRQKPAMSTEHNHVATFLLLQLGRQLDLAVFEPRLNMGHVQHTPENYYIPDVFVVPTELVRANRGSHALEAYSSPLPLVVEVWSPSTGTFDVEAKLQQYQRRGDLEIWRIHPYERTLTTWRRQSDGTYDEVQFAGGMVQPIALAGVTVDLDALFA
jgi:Uma2 family endonuclease